MIELRDLAELADYLPLLVELFDREHDYGADDDPAATREMVDSLCLIGDKLRRQFPYEFGGGSVGDAPIADQPLFVADSDAA